MKKLLNILPGVIAGIASVLLLAGCFNQFSPAPARDVSGEGAVTIFIGDGNSRTLFPQTPAFSRYELQFTPGSGQAAKSPESVTSASLVIALAAGNWTITAVAYVNISGVAEIPDGEYEAARGGNTVNVLPEQNNSVGIDIHGGVEAGKGVFNYTFSYPADVSAAKMSILTLSGTVTKEVNLKETAASGSFALDTGYYILRLELEKNGGKIIKVEVIHIYKNMTTAASGTDYTFTDANFLFAVDTDTNVTAGTMTHYVAENMFFSMAAVPGRITFPTGTDDSGTATVGVPYQIGETEVTWELWDTVRTWALANGYSNITAGQKGNSGGGSDQQPVTTVTWYSMIVWCNALTEWWNEKTGASLATVYNSGGPIRNGNDTTALNSVTPVPNARGFRLPTGNEWELAARWQGQTDLGNSVVKNGYYFTKGNSASGAAGPYTNSAATGAVAVFYDNHNTTQDVKSKAPNALNLYDMGGNIAEFCFEWEPGQNHPITRGGCYQDTTNQYMQLGFHVNDPPGSLADIYGFRLARTGYKTGEIVLPPEVNAPIEINFTGPEDESIGIVNIVDITQDPYYNPSWPVLQNDVWYDDSNPVTYYQFYAQAGTAYSVTWNDSYQGNGTKTADVGVSAYWKASNDSIFGRTDSGWNSPKTFTADRSGIVVLKVEYYSGGNTSGTFALKYSGGSIRQTDTLVLSAPAGYAAYQWIVDNISLPDTANTITLAAGSLGLGPHSVTLVIYKQEGSVQVPYSKTLAFTVEP